MARDKICTPFLALASPENKFTVSTIEDMQSRKYLKIGDIVELNGYYAAGDGAGHKRKIEATDDGSGVQLANGLWANIVHNGEVNVSWFGAKGDGISDDSLAIQRTLDYSLKGTYNPSVSSNSFANNSISFDCKEYILNSPVEFKPSRRTQGLLMNGNHCRIIFYTGLFINKDLALKIKFDNIHFVGKNSSEIMFYSESHGGAQRYTFTGCDFAGDMLYGLDLKGTNNNSEFKFDNCFFGGKWESFLHSGGSNISNQFLNYWFLNCGYWTSSNWIHLEAGGHVHVTDCDISGYSPTKKTYLYYLRGSGDGVQTFIDKGCRYELKSENACVIDVSNDITHVIFDGSDFSSNNGRVEFIPECFKFDALNNTGRNSVKFKDSVLTGGFMFSGNGETVRKAKFENCNYVGQVSDFNRVFSMVKGVNSSRGWSIEFDTFNFRGHTVNGTLETTIQKTSSKIYTDILVNPYNNLDGSLVKKVFFPTNITANCILRHAYDGNTYHGYLRSLCCKVTEVDTINARIKIEYLNKSMISVGNILTKDGSLFYTVTGSTDRGYIVLDTVNSINVGELLYMSILSFKSKPNDNLARKVIESTSTYLVDSDLELIIPNVSSGGIPGNITIFTNKIKKAEIVSQLFSLNTPYHTLKMQQEGVYEDFITYMDEKTEYDRLQREAENQPEGIMMLPVIEEPQPSEKLLAFKEKYLG